MHSPHYGKPGPVDNLDPRQHHFCVMHRHTYRKGPEVQQTDRLRAPKMLLIGSACRHAGKTELACRTLTAESSRRPVQAFKVTMLHAHEPVCASKTGACPGCAAHRDVFCLTDETSRKGRKDTQRLLASGARRVLWLRTRREHLREAAVALLQELGADIPAIGESNSLRLLVEPDLFLMVRRPGETMKTSASAVLEYVNNMVDSDGHAFSLDLDRLRFGEHGWSLAGIIHEGT
jgi:hypothetical protein